MAKESLTFPPIPPEIDPRIAMWLQQLRTNLDADLVPAVFLGVLPEVESLPEATEDQRGRMVMVKGGAGVADAIHVCRKTAADAYEWVTVP